MTRWPKSESYKKRYIVPDLSPEQRKQLAGERPAIVFVAESPHLSEVEPADRLARRPLCGKAGRDWWRMVGGLVEGDSRPDTDLERLLHLCQKGRLAVMNAVQYPIDPKITMHCGSDADPIEFLGFSKVPPASFKKLKNSEEVQSAIHALRARLVHESVSHLPVVSLGNDAQWFVTQALGEQVGAGRHLETVPHPSAWWRQGGRLRERARDQLTRLFAEHVTARSRRTNIRVLA